MMSNVLTSGSGEFAAYRPDRDVRVGRPPVGVNGASRGRPRGASLPGPDGAHHRRLAQAASRFRLPISGYAILASLVGLTSPFTVRLVGLMPLSEIVLLAVIVPVVLYLLLIRKPLRLPLLATTLFKVLLVCQVVALFGYVFSDLYRGSHSGDAIRGWARMVFLALDLGAVALLFGATRHGFLFLMIGVVESAVHVVIVNAPLFGDYWKFGYGVPCTVAVFLLASLTGRWLAPCVVAGMGAVHFLMDFRSMALICGLAAALLGLNTLPARLRAFVFWNAAVAVAVLLAVSTSREASVTSDRAQRSNAERSAMMMAAWGGFAESPLVGQGSWFSNSRVMDTFLAIRAENARLSGVGGFDENDAEGLAIHSQILVSLAEGGILGGLFFVVYGAVLLWTVYLAAVVLPWTTRTPIALFVLISSLFALGFSPFSGAARVDIAVAAGVALLYWRERAVSIAQTRAAAPAFSWSRPRFA